NLLSYSNTGHGIYLGTVTNGSITNAKCYSNGGRGMMTNVVSGYTFQNFITANNNNDGFGFYEASDSKVFNLKTYNNLGYGFNLTGSGSDNNTIVAVLSANNNSYGITSGAASGNTWAFITSVNNNGYGMGVGGDTVTITQVMTSNNLNYGMAFQGTTAKAAQLNIANSTNAIWFYDTSTNHFTGNLVVGGNCVFSGTNTDPGLQNATCDAQNTSNNVTTTGVSHTSSYVGKVTSTDGSNGSNSNGTSAFASVTDWINFSDMYRAWGEDGSAFANSDHQGHCDGAETCRIWDWRLATGDTASLNKSHDGTNANPAWTNGANCPANVHGNVAISDQKASPQTYLLNAIELVEDTTGDNDGLCESNEACIYAPNFGYYQGEGTYSGNTCTFQNGTVTGVTLYRLGTNGG
ncbi:MAG TPA: right-handed parallel beta-helix repeat-containing protein, partial [Bdellovibrionales bacterium]|nr:right-handed parallel beta-helix repeat-containing protein [Bdellovibrionales bacterium]